MQKSPTFHRPAIVDAPTRRKALVALTAISLLRLTTANAMAAEDQLARTIADIAKGRAIGQGRVRLELPTLAENGNSVAMTVSVDSPMTATDHVKTIHIVSEKNPIADVVVVHLGPRAGRAVVKSNIRLADTQQVVALAIMSDGSIWSGSASVIVALAACIDGG